MIDPKTLTPGDSVYRATFVEGEGNGDLTIWCRRLVVLECSRIDSELRVVVPTCEAAGNLGDSLIAASESLYATPAEATRAVITDLKARCESLMALVTKAETQLAAFRICGSVSVAMPSDADERDGE